MNRSMAPGLPALALALLSAGAGLAAGLFLGRGLRPGPETSDRSDESAVLYTCGMHPQVIQSGPGICPICHMKLTPLAARDAGSGSSLTIDPVIIQNMGLRVDRVAEGPLMRTVRAPGYFREAQPSQRDISLKVGGWVRRLFADTEGMHVKKGDVLLELYSPEVLAAQAEVIAARRALEGLQGADPLPRQDAALVLELGKEKLRLWDLAPEDVEAIAAEPQPRATVLIRSPAEGHLVEKKVVAGSAVKAGESILRIVDHTLLWLDAHVYERDLAFVGAGQAAAAAVPAFPGRTFAASVILIHPHVDEVTRAATVRLAVENPAFELRPGMYAAVEFPARAVEKTLLVPREAVIDTGERQVVFVALDGGRFEPREVQTGLEDDRGAVQVLAGLAAGELVVTSGQFLLDAESRMREAERKFLDERRLKADGGPGSAAASPAGSRRAAAPGPPLAEAERRQVAPRVEAFLPRYLEAARALAQDDLDRAARAARDLPPLARELAAAAAGTALAAAASELEKACAALTGKPLADFRKGFSVLSGALIAIVERAPPAAGALPGLKLVHCSMYPGSWLQTEDQIANPYYGAAMHRCGEVVSAVAPGPAAGAPAGVK